jgi:hypothetical protein
MEKSCRRILGKRNLIFVFISLMMIGSFAFQSYGEEEGKRTSNQSSGKGVLFSLSEEQGWLSIITIMK